jgi:putative sterol carrier protein
MNQTTKEFFLNTVSQRAKAANDNLKASLKGIITLNLKEPNEVFTIDWRGSECTVTEGELKEIPDGAAHATITLSQKNCVDITEGDLNPQMAMLSRKVKTEGDIALAVYFFNLLRGTR